MKFLKKVGTYDGDKTLTEKKQNSVYSVNWDKIFKTAQETLAENIIESTADLGVYHTRVLRILKTKGYLNETDLSSMCLLPPRDTRAVVNTLIKLGFIKNLTVPLNTANQKAGTLVTGPIMMMYGVNYTQMQKLLSTKIL